MSGKHVIFMGEAGTCKKAGTTKQVQPTAVKSLARI